MSGIACRPEVARHPGANRCQTFRLERIWRFVRVVVHVTESPVRTAPGEWAADSHPDRRERRPGTSFRKLL